ncbi:MAG: hypothetical protein VB084_05450 [Syntrophomonadaceae bacterium]|nr:hypothetical protein [Syntrophomonadaceae bacterium]
MSKLSNNRGCTWKFNHKPRSRKSKIPSQRYTIILDQCIHDSFSYYKYDDRKAPYRQKPDPGFDLPDEGEGRKHRKLRDGRKDYYKKPDREGMTTDFPEECERCIPRCGELIIDGGFEHKPDHLFGWVYKSGVELINPDIGEIAHQGAKAVRLGSSHHYAVLYQDVPGICPGIFYQLDFYLSAATEYSNADILVLLEFLDYDRNVLDHPALNLLIPADSLSSIAYTGFSNSTKIPAPPDTRLARISFEINTHHHPERHVHLDDISLIAIWNPAH